MGVGRRARRHRAAVVAGAVLLGLGSAARPAPAQETVPRWPGFEPCEGEGFDGRTLCGTVSVWEDPDVRERRLSLRVLVLRSEAPDSVRQPDPVLVLDGGPGQAASRTVEWVARDLDAVLRTRDVVLPDRRGTGASNPLDCPGEPGPATDPSATVVPRTPENTRACREHLEGRADLGKYTSPFAADDVAALADSLGIERLNLYGGSYGSREAFELVRRHARLVRSVAVFAVTPQHRRALLESPRSAERAMQRLIDDCMADDRCRTAYPDLRRELREVVERLEASPAAFTVPLPEGGRSGPLEIDRTAFGSVLRTALLSGGQAAQLPALIHAAHGGDFDLVGAAWVRIARLTPAAMSRGLFLSVVCAEEMARLEPAQIAAAGEGTFWGDGWVRDVARQCADWPVGELPGDWHEPPAGPQPMLLLSGWLDPIAPPAWAEQLRRHMPNARRVVVREGHHGIALEPCGREALARFYEEVDPFGLDVACIARAERPDFVVLPEGGP